MAVEALTLKIGSDTKSLAAWGVTAGQLVTTLGGKDHLQITIAENISAPATIPPFAQVDLMCDGTRIFCGWLDQAPKTAEGGAQGRTYVIIGPHRWLDETTYLQDIVLTGASGAELSELATSTTVLNQIIIDNGDGTFSLGKATFAEQLQDIFALVASQHPGKLALDHADAPVVTLPEDERTDATALSLLEILFKSVPAARVRWDYTETTPTYHFVADPEVHTIQADAETAAQFVPRYDLLCKSVTILFFRETASGGRVLIATDQAGPSGDAATLNATRQLVETITLRGDQCGPVEPTPTGMADAYYQLVGTLWNEGEIQLPGIRPDILPGDDCVIDAPYAALGTAPTPAQTITRDLAARRTTVQIGPPAWLGIRERYDLATANRSRRASARCPNQPETEGEISGGPLEPVAIPGTANVRVFQGFVAGELPSDMSFGDDPPFILEGLTGDGVIYARLQVDSDGSPTAASVLTGLSVPNDDNDTAHYVLGSYKVTSGIVEVSGGSAGNLNYVRCRDYYSNPATYTHTLKRESA